MVKYYGIMPNIWEFLHSAIACEDGKFGLGCNESCGQCLDPNNCSKEDGTCLHGCAQGYNGSLCKTR